MSYPYSFIEDWWGEPLTPLLQRRIEAAPQNHLAIFRMGMQEQSDHLIAAIPTRATGILRPIIRPVRSQSGKIVNSASLSMALNILLYSHEAIIESPLRAHRIRDIPRETAQLLAIKPLVDAGAIHLGHVDSRSNHPSLYGPGSSEATDHAIRMVYPDIRTRLGQEDLVRAVDEVLGIVNLANRLPNRANALARDETEFKILTAILRAAWIDRSYYDLASLARMSLPSLGGKISELVAVRQSEESFFQWREALSKAITALDRIPDDRSDWQRDARDIVYSELEPLRNNISRENSRSGALAALSRGVSTVLIGGAGLIAGWATGGGLASAAASSGASIGITSAAEYLGKLKERREHKAILDLALAFKSDAI